MLSVNLVCHLKYETKCDLSWAILPLMAHDILIKSNNTHEFLLLNSYMKEIRHTINFEKKSLHIPLDEYIIYQDIETLFYKAKGGNVFWYGIGRHYPDGFEFGYWMDGDYKRMREYASIAPILESVIDHDLFTMNRLTFEKKYGDDCEVYMRKLFKRLINSLTNK